LATLADMKQVPVGQLKQNASALIREMEESGEPIEITAHGRPVARLVRVPRPSDVQSLIDAGAMIPPTKSWDPPEPLPPLPGVPLPSELLAQLRADER
jgi:prevent-host-death family protein